MREGPPYVNVSDQELADRLNRLRLPTPPLQFGTVFVTPQPRQSESRTVMTDRAATPAATQAQQQGQQQRPFDLSDAHRVLQVHDAGLTSLQKHLEKSDKSQTLINESLATVKRRQEITDGLIEQLKSHFEDALNDSLDQLPTLVDIEKIKADAAQQTASMMELLRQVQAQVGQLQSGQVAGPPTSTEGIRAALRLMLAAAT